MSTAALRGSGNAVRALVFLTIVLTAAPQVRAQAAPLEHTFHASRTVVESGLRELGAYAGGKLPILDGFVAGEPSLDRYRQGYYQYSVQLKEGVPGQTQVRVTAKITAWYAAADQSHSGYRVLPSNGRLEADLLERLDERLTGHSVEAVASADQHSHGVPGVFSPLPDRPVTARESAGAGAVGLRAPTVRPQSSNPLPISNADEQQVRQLREQLKSLQEILKNQTHPDDLAAVKNSNTPVLASPMEGAQVVLRADHGDEFQILEIQGSWIHVRIAGLSRGWIQRSQLELPAMASGSQSSEISQLAESSFRKSREETSTFPGNWEPLQGKRVKIIWVRSVGNGGQDNKATFAKSIFRQTYAEVSQREPDLGGVVIVFDSQDGGMAAATLPVLQQWAAGHLTDNAFWKRCWFDPADGFKLKE
jgi:hypothetical protein